MKPEFWSDDESTGVWPVDEKLVYIGLWNLADDAGRLEWRPRQIQLALFPYPEGALLTRGGGILDIVGILERLVSSGKVETYEWEGKQYAQIVNFMEHQHPDNPLCKYPDQKGTKVGFPRNKAIHRQTSESSRQITIPSIESSVRPLPVSDPSPGNDVLSRPDRIGSDRIGSDLEAGAEPFGPGATPDPVSAYTLPCTGKDKTFEIRCSMLDAWKSDFPGVNVEQALRHMHAWSEANPSKRKTRRGMMAFIVRWLSKEQDKTATSGQKRGANGATGGSGQFTAEEWDRAERWAKEDARDPVPDERNDISSGGDGDVGALSPPADLVPCAKHPLLSPLGAAMVHRGRTRKLQDDVHAEPGDRPGGDGQKKDTVRHA